MANVAQFMVTPTVQDQASAPLEQISAAANRTGEAVETMDRKVGRTSATFDALAAGLSRTDRAQQQIERSTAAITARMEAAEQAARAEGVAQERLSAVLAAGGAAREQAALRAVRGLSAEQQAAALARAGYGQLATQIEATARAQVALAGTPAAARINDFAAANDNAGRSLGRTTQLLGAAGTQAGDFAAQVASGGSALTAFGQQAAQMGGYFGPTGAIAGAVIMFGALAAKMVLGKSETDAWTDSIKRQADAFSAAEGDARRWREGLETESRSVRELTEYYDRLGQARQGQERRQFERDRADFDQRQGGLRNDALGITRGLAQQFQQQLADLERQAANSYGRGSQEFNLIMSDETVSRLREIVRVVNDFQASGVVTRETLALLSQQLLALGDGSDVVARRIRAQAEVVDGLTGRARESEEVQRQLTARAAALGVEFAGAASAADRLARAMQALRQFDGDVFRGLNRETEELRRQLAAAASGAESLKREQANIARENRVNQLVQQRYEEMQRRGALGDTAVEELDAYRASVNATLQTNQGLQEGLDRLRDGFRSTGSSTREANDSLREFLTLQRDAATGLLVANPAEQRLAAEFVRQVRGTDLDPAKRRREAEAAAQETRRSIEEQVREAEQSARSIESTFTGAFSRIFDGAGNKSESFFQSIVKAGRNAAATLASQMVFRLAVIPTVNAGANLLGYSGNLIAPLSTSLNSFFGGMGGTAGPTQAAALAAQQAGQGGLASQAGMVSSASSLYRGVSGLSTGLGSFFPGGNAVNTGFGTIDGALNTTLFTTPVTAGESAFRTAAGLSASPGVTVGQVLGPAAAIGGGIYGMVSGIQRGGIGGYTSAAGGAISAVTGGAMLGSAMGLLPALGALGPAGLIAGAVLAIAGSLLPGQKPSSKGQEASVDLLRGDEWGRGLTGDRFSQDNQDEARRFTNSIRDLETQLEARLGFSATGEAAVGVTSGRNGNDAGRLYLRVNGTSQDFTRDEDGAKQLADRAAALLLEGFKADAARLGRDDDQARILRASGSTDELGKNLEWYEGPYKTLSNTAEATNQFAASVAALAKPYDEAIIKAAELGLATEALSAARDEAAVKARAARDDQVKGIMLALDQRAAAAGGDAFDPARALDAERKSRDAAFKAEFDQLVAQMKALGTWAEGAAQPYLDTLSKVQELERAAFERAAAKARAATAKAQEFDVRGLDVSLWQRLAVNDNAALLDAAMYQAALDAEKEMETTRAQLEAWGLSAGMVATRMDTLRKAQELEAGTREATLREQIELNDKAAQAAKAAGEAQLASARGVLDWLDQQALGGNSSLTGVARAQEAQRQFDAALGGADAAALTRSADAYLTASRAAYGGATGAYAAAEARTRQAVADFGIRQSTSGNADVVAVVRELKAVMQQVADSQARMAEAQDRAALLATVGLAA